MTLTITDLCCGAGLTSIVARDLGMEIANAVDINPDTLDTYARNFPATNTLGSSLQSADWLDIAPTSWVHASPPCTRASEANTNGETYEDRAIANGIINCIESMQVRTDSLYPWYVTIENVPAYERFESFQEIEKALRRQGFLVGRHIGNAAGFGAPQNRRRLWLMAVRPDRVQAIQGSLLDGGNLLEPMPTHDPLGWIVPFRDPAGREYLNSLPRRYLADYQERQVEASQAASHQIALILRAGSNPSAKAVLSHDPCPTLRALEANGGKQFDLWIPSQGAKELDWWFYWKIQAHGYRGPDFDWGDWSDARIRQAIGNGVAYAHARKVFEHMLGGADGN